MIYSMKWSKLFALFLHIRVAEGQRIVLEYCLRASGYFSCAEDNELSAHNMALLQTLNGACQVSKQGKCIVLHHVLFLCVYLFHTLLPILTGISVWYYYACVVHNLSRIWLF